MDLSDALDGEATPSNLSNLQAGGQTWPGQPTNPSWPGQPQNPTWPGQQPGMPSWPNQPNQPAWPGQPSQPFGWPEPNAPQNMPLTVPYTLPLPSGVYDRMLITINGEPKRNAKKFSVNLLKNKDIAFHFNPRFDENGIKVIVRNTMINDEWGTEERIAPAFPFVPETPFEMKLLCTSNDFRVAVNRAHLVEYKHRVRELNQINCLTVLDDVKLLSVDIQTL